MHILLADDHTLFRSGLRRILEGDLRNVNIDEVSSLPELLDVVSKKFFDLLILDISFGDDNGLKAIPNIKNSQPNLPILILSMYKENQFVIQAIKAGATGYLTKDRAPHELLRAIEVVMAGRRYLDESIAAQIAEHLASSSNALPHQSLSSREFEVFQLIASAKTVSEIASELCLSVKTISTYRSRILEKMSLKSNAEIMHYAISKGLVKKSL